MATVVVKGLRLCHIVDGVRHVDEYVKFTSHVFPLRLLKALYVIDELSVIQCDKCSLSLITSRSITYCMLYFHCTWCLLLDCHAGAVGSSV